MRGINTKAQLAEAEAVAAAAAAPGGDGAGVTLVAPETVFLSRRHQIRRATSWSNPMSCSAPG